MGATVLKGVAGLDQKRMGRLIVGILGVIVAAGYLVMALQMPLGTAASPGPGMYPVGVGVAGIVISLIVIGEALFSKATSGALDLPKGPRVKLVVGFFLLTTAYILLLPVLGQYIAATLYVMAMLRFLGRIAWWKVVVYGVVAGAGVSWVFIELLSVRLPQGMIL